MGDEVLFVSAVKGQVVQRYGMALMIGVTRDPADPSKLSWDEQLVVQISAAELVQYRREYQRALAEGALKKRTAAEFEAQVKGEADLVAQETAAREAAAVAAATPPAEPGPAPLEKAKKPAAKTLEKE